METSITYRNHQTGVSVKTLKGAFKNSPTTRTPMPENANAWKEKDAVPSYWCKNSGLASLRKKDEKLNYLQRRVDGFKPTPKVHKEEDLLFPQLKNNLQTGSEEPYINRQRMNQQPG